MSSIVNLHARPGEGATLTLWRTGVTNASATVTLNLTPALAGASATAFTDASGPDQGRIDITIPTNAVAGSYQWTAEIAASEIWYGQVFIEPHGYPTSQLATSVDIRTERVPSWIIPRAEDVDGGTFDAPATGIVETGGPTNLAIGSIPDLSFLTRSGAGVAGVAHGNTGNPHTQYLLRAERTYHVLTAATETTSGSGAAIAGWGALTLGVGELIRYTIHGTYQSAGAVAAQFRLDSLSLAPLQVSGLWTIATGVTAAATATHAVNAVNTSTANVTPPAAVDTSYPFSASGFIRGDTLTGTFRFRIFPSVAGTAVRVMPNSILILERTLL